MKTTKIMLKTIFFLMSLFFTTTKVNGQGWERTYGGVNYDVGFSVQQTTDGYIVAGGLDYLFGLIKTNNNGDTTWIKTCGEGTANFIKQTADGGYIAIGFKYVGWKHDVYLVKTDINGDTLWTKNYGEIDETETGYWVSQTLDSGYIIAGEATVKDTFNSSDIYVIKTNSNGDTLWTRTFGGISADYGRFAEQTPDSGYIIGGHDNSNAPGGGQPCLIKIDANGNKIWTKYPGLFVFGQCFQQTTDGGYIISGWGGGANGDDIFLVKTNSNGDTLWTKTFGGTDVDIASSVQQTMDGGYIITGYTYSFGAGLSDVYLLKTNANGDSLWTKTFGGTSSDFGYSVQQTADGGYIVAGATGSFGAGSNDVYLIKTDSSGNSITNIISGYVFNDIDNDCQKDSGEIALNNQVIKITPGKKYVTTDPNGNYSALVDTGTFKISIASQHPYLQQTCPDSSYSVTFTQFYDTSANNNFGNQITIYCPLMWVDISTGLVRACRQNTYSVNYCNNGTADANNSYIEIEFPSQIIPLSSSPISWSSVNGNIYRFDLGTVAIGQCGTIYITDSVLCDAVLGSTVCVKANIYPDTICTPLDTVWDKSSLVVSGECIGDLLACFTILNHGSTMTGNTQYRIYANDTLILTQTFQLNADDSIVYCIASQGKTIRLEADQRPGHPGKSRPRATVEGCGTPSDFGFVTTVPEDDEDDFVEEDCQIVRTSYDPNEKLVKPEGITTNRFVSAKDELEYQINFQNTGNDTAFLVVIRDTLNDNVVDIGTVVSGASSHPYSFRIYGQGVLEWKFQNIFLPDSNVNEAESHGFVKFKVKQANNPKGTVISNHAGIYFDFNAPVLTADATVTVFDTVFQATGIKELAVGSGSKQFNILPNPFSDHTSINYSLEKNSLVNAELYNIIGEKVAVILNQQYKTTGNHQLTLSSGQLKLHEGIYLVKLTIDGYVTTKKVLLVR